MRTAIYRSGLRLHGSLQLRTALIQYIDDISNILHAAPSDPVQNDALLLRIVRSCVATVDELEKLRGLDAEKVSAALEAWIAGDSEPDIIERFPDVWEKLAPGDLDTLLPWAVTGALEIAAALADDAALRDAGHERLAPSRIRYGTFDASLCQLIRDGRDRILVSALAREYLHATARITGLVLPMDVAVEFKLAELQPEAETEGSNGDSDLA